MHLTPDLQVLLTVGQRDPKAEQCASKNNANETGYRVKASCTSLVLVVQASK